MNLVSNLIKQFTEELQYTVLSSAEITVEQCSVFCPKCVALVMFPCVIAQDFVFVFVLLQFNISYYVRVHFTLVQQMYGCADQCSKCTLHTAHFPRGPGFLCIVTSTLLSF